MFQPHKAISWGCCRRIRFQIGMRPDPRARLCTTNTNTHTNGVLFRIHPPPGVLFSVRLSCSGERAGLQRAHCAKVREGLTAAATHVGAAPLRHLFATFGVAL